MSAAFQQVLALTALLAGVGFLMVFVGAEKRVLEWKRRTCPACGRSAQQGYRCRVR